MNGLPIYLLAFLLFSSFVFNLQIIYLIYIWMIIPI